MIIKEESINQSLISVQETKEGFQENILSFGISYLDDALSGITPNDFIVLAGYTGGGKSEMAVSIAMSAARSNPDKDVLFFALEAHKNEITLRFLYKEMTRLYWSANKETASSNYNYQSWVTGKSKFLDEYEQQAKENIKKINNLKVLYTGEFFTIEDFQDSMMGNTKNYYSLVVLDHLHYFDIDGANENTALHNIVKTLRNIFLKKEIPLVLVSHVRKKDNRLPQIVPTSDDLHGTSNISKVATKIITLASGYGVNIATNDRTQNMGKGFSTFIKIAKNRLGQHPLEFIALTKFNSLKNEYSDSYVLGKQATEDKELIFKPIDNFDIPFWAESESWNKKNAVTKRK